MAPAWSQGRESARSCKLMWPGDRCPVCGGGGGGGHLCKQTWPGDGYPIWQASLPSQGQILGWLHLCGSPSHFPVSHHRSREERACNYPFNTWVPDSELISEPMLHLTSPAPSPALWGDSLCRPTAQPLCGFGFFFVLRF